VDPLVQVRHYQYDPAGDLLSHLPGTQDGLRAARFENTTYRFDAAGNLDTRQTADQLTRFEYDP
jgi:hypothetical protein